MSLPLSGKVALVTGSSRSIGAAIAKRLAADGAAVVINYVKTASAAEQLADEINAAGTGSAIAIQADMASIAEGHRLVEETVRRLGRLDILVLNAGTAENQTLEGLTEAAFDNVFTVNVKVPLFMAQTAAKHLKPGARVIFISSVVTKFSGVAPPSLTYAATKGAVEQLTRVLAKDLGAKGITVNSVAPGPIDTELFRKGKTQETVDFIANQHPLKRIGEVGDLAPIVAFLARGEAGWINGQTILVNGGHTV